MTTGRREELLAAAREVLATNGYERTTVSSIATRANVAQGTFYLYFASKEVLLHELQERFVTGFLQRLEAAMDRCGPDRWRPRLQVWVKTIIEGYLENVRLHDVIFHETHQEYDRHSMSHNPVIDQLTTLFGGGAQAGAWVSEDPRATAVMFFHAMHGAVDSAIADNKKVNRAKLIRSITTFIERAVNAT